MTPGIGRGVGWGRGVPHGRLGLAPGRGAEPPDSHAPAAPAVPPALEGLRVVRRGPHSLSLRWQPVPGARGFRLRWRPEGEWGVPGGPWAGR